MTIQLPIIERRSITSWTVIIALVGDPRLEHLEVSTFKPARSRKFDDVFLMFRMLFFCFSSRDFRRRCGRVTTTCWIFKRVLRFTRSPSRLGIAMQYHRASFDFNGFRFQSRLHYYVIIIQFTKENTPETCTQKSGTLSFELTCLS